ncbi:DUF1349 domain-containing protein [Priestia flexa]|uniref:DUF1349 domain-containing protein n=1 Tax=Priestia flexa TaxID=86664 RepID=UPI0024C05953|nr:DUF1349 domain-containing protein [Priestia flexa]WHX79780.1 DUF1349 domain-containing protein [Priestia flexa]
MPQTFHGKELLKEFKWFSKPTHFELNEQHLVMKPNVNTDFWQRTHYGFQVDNGHFLYKEVSGDFQLTTKVHTKPLNRYDQAGLMVRVSKDTWIKSSVEYIPNESNKLGAVVINNGYSDWSTQDFEEDQSALYFRMKKVGQDYSLYYSVDGEKWKQLRIAHLFAEEETMQIGIYACSPQGEGYEASFEFVEIQQ